VTSCRHGTTSQVKRLSKNAGSARFGLLLLPLPTVWLVACPIPPDFPVDAGPDSGVILDAGVDAGVGGSVTATLTTSSNGSGSLAWNGSDLDSTSIDAEGPSGPTQVTISAANRGAGTFKLTIGGLVPGSTTGTVLSVTYQPPGGPNSWTCSGSVNCGGAAALSSYTGSAIAGTFTIIFPTDGVGVSAELSDGKFSVTLP
jgi:hypothetical protein